MNCKKKISGYSSRGDCLMVNGNIQCIECAKLGDFLARTMATAERISDQRFYNETVDIFTDVMVERFWAELAKVGSGHGKTQIINVIRDKHPVFAETIMKRQAVMTETLKRLNFYHHGEELDDKAVVTGSLPSPNFPIIAMPDRINPQEYTMRHYTPKLLPPDLLLKPHELIPVSMPKLPPGFNIVFDDDAKPSFIRAYDVGWGKDYSVETVAYKDSKGEIMYIAREEYENMQFAKKITMLTDLFPNGITAINVNGDWVPVVDQDFEIPELVYKLISPKDFNLGKGVSDEVLDIQDTMNKILPPHSLYLQDRFDELKMKREQLDHETKVMKLLEATGEIADMSDHVEPTAVGARLMQEQFEAQTRGILMRAGARFADDDQDEHYVVRRSGFDVKPRNPGFTSEVQNWYANEIEWRYGVYQKPPHRHDGEDSDCQKCFWRSAVCDGCGAILKPTEHIDDWAVEHYQHKEKTGVSEKFSHICRECGKSTGSYWLFCAEGCEHKYFNKPPESEPKQLNENNS